MARGFSPGGRSGGSSGGGSRGGSSGGGFNFGGINLGGIFSSGPRHDPPPRHHHHRRPPRGPRHMRFFGRTIVVTTGFQSLMSLLLIGILFFCFMFYFSISSMKQAKAYVDDSKQMVQKYEDGADQFLDIIEKAKSGNYENYKIVMGTYDPAKELDYSGGHDPFMDGIYKCMFREGVWWYFVAYEYVDLDGEEQLDWTFTQYLRQDLPSGGFNEEIEIAIAKINGQNWAINTDFSLDVCQEYLEEVESLESQQKVYKSAVTKVVIYSVILVVVILVVVLVLVRKFKTAQKKEELEIAKSEAEVAEAQAKAEEAERVAKTKGRVCRYCGADVPDGDETCPGCGSREFD